MERTPHRKRSTLVALAAGCVLAASAALLSAALAGAQILKQADSRPPETVVGLGMTPATIERDLPSRRFEIPYTLFNQQARAQTVDVAITGLGHDLDGTPAYGGVAPTVALSQTHLVLAPGERRGFRVSGEIPAGRGGLHFGVSATLASRPAATAAIAVESRVAAVVLLRGPKPWTETLSVEAVDVAPARDGDRTELVAVVRNTGDVHLRPTGTIRVSRAGKQIGTAQMQSQLVLPGSARRLRARWDGARGDLKDATFAVFFGPTDAPAGSVTPVTAPRSSTATGTPSEDRWDWRLLLAALLLVVSLGLWLALARRGKRERERRAREAAIDAAVALALAQQARVARRARSRSST